MSNYSNNPAHVRVDFFKPSGKWYATESVDMTGFWATLTLDAVKSAVSFHLRDRYLGMTVVCLEPYCEHSFPVLFKIPVS